MLTYEARSFVPDTGHWVPCRSHGYCVVIRRGQVGTKGSGFSGVTRARPRNSRDLLAWLESRPVTTVPALRRSRFTLRLVVDAERAGLIAVDWEAESVERLLHRGHEPAGSDTADETSIAHGEHFQQANSTERRGF